MLILIFDTETSGLNPYWNVILQLSYQIVDSDNWSVKKSANHYFPWPQNKNRVSPDAIDVNGLTEEMLATKQLSDRKTALTEFIADRDRCSLIVAHNLDFDKNFIISSCDEEGVKFAKCGWTSTYDTMKKTTRFCAIPKNWGSGYKWPKLTELADCLGVGYSDINLHDSSGDVELTKRCFRSLVLVGEYEMHEGGGEINVQIIVDGPDDIYFKAWDDNGTEISENKLSMMVSKSRWKEFCKDLLIKWCEANAEEREEFIKICRNAPAIRPIESYKEEIENIHPATYTRKPFCEQEPTQNGTRRALEVEAERKIRSILFWTNKQKRLDYVNERLEPLYNALKAEYDSKLAEHEANEDAIEKTFNAKSQQECNERIKYLTALAEGREEVLHRALNAVGYEEFPLPQKVSVSIENDGLIHVDIQLPRIEDFPTFKGYRLPSGNYKVKNLTDKDMRTDYAESVMGLSFLVIAKLFNVSPVVQTIRVDAHALRISQQEDCENDDYLYSFIINRNEASSIDFNNFNPIEGIQSLEHLLNISKTFVFKPVDIKKQLALPNNPL